MYLHSGAHDRPGSYPAHYAAWHSWMASPDVLHAAGCVDGDNKPSLPRKELKLGREGCGLYDMKPAYTVVLREVGYE